jgi:hypothetical protein
MPATYTLTLRCDTEGCEALCDAIEETYIHVDPRLAWQEARQDGWDVPDGRPVACPTCVAQRSRRTMPTSTPMTRAEHPCPEPGCLHPRDHLALHQNAAGTLWSGIRDEEPPRCTLCHAPGVATCAACGEATCADHTTSGTPATAALCCPWCDPLGEPQP